MTDKQRHERKYTEPETLEENPAPCDNCWRASVCKEPCASYNCWERSGV